MPERVNERVARQVVARALGLRVSRYEDGGSDSQVDALIHGPDGVAALEVVADHEEAFNAQWDALGKTKHRVEVPALERVWSAQLARTARVKDVVSKLPALVLALEEQRHVSGCTASEALAESLARLRVRMLYPVEGDQAGWINLHAQGWSGGSSLTMAQYVEKVLAEAADVPYKLGLHPAPAKHAFIWTTIGTDYEVQSVLERRMQPLPTDAPSLPTGVTHVWVVGSFTSQGAVAWFPDRGWWRPEWMWPVGEPMALRENAAGDALP